MEGQPRTATGTGRGVSFADHSPALVSEWHPTKNGELRPSDVTFGSNRSVWWVCRLGHEWQASCNKRTAGRGCPVCAGKRCDPGVNDLATTNPSVAREWHPTKNGDLAPTMVLKGNGKPVWWLCTAGHEWQVSPNQRTAPPGTGCPMCSGKLVLPGANDMVTTHPQMASEWHPTKNGDLVPSSLRAGTNLRVWWQCSEGHEWIASGNQRTRGTECPICSGSRALSGVNDMVTTHPQMASEWHPTKNGDLLPLEVVAGTSRRLWWQCSEGHEWQVSGNARIRRGSGCPFCAGQRVIPGVNDMATTHVQLASEFHPSKNGVLTPADIIAGTSRRIWWLCPSGHEWQAVGRSRAVGTGCPICATTGFDPSKPALIYFIQHDTFDARKVGITNVGTTRLKDFRRLGWRVIQTNTLDHGEVIRATEKRVLNWIRVDLGLPQHLGPLEMGRAGGWSETFSGQGPSNEEVTRMIEDSIMAVLSEMGDE